MEGIKDYPSGMVMRQNYFAPMYCEMAMEAFYDLFITYRQLQKDKWLVPADEEFDLSEYIHKKASITVVFSAMAVEAFINNYLSIRMGDEEFLDRFDRKPYRDKLDYLMKLVHPHDHDQQWYKDVRELFLIRNAYVHSHSSETPVEYLLQKIKDDNEREKAATRVATAKKEDNTDVYAQYRAVFFNDDSNDERDGDDWSLKITGSDLRLSGETKKNIKECVNYARLALVALCNFTRYVSHYDPNTRAFSFIFTPPKKFGLEGYKKEIRETAFEEIKVYMQNRRNN